MSARGPLPSNRRLARDPAGPGELASVPVVVEAPREIASPYADGESPPPPAAVATVRPPSPARGHAALLDRLQMAAGLLIVVAASLGVAWGARRYVTSSPRFAVRTVAVEGAARLRPERVASIAGVVVGRNIFSLDLEAARAALLAEPWIVRASLARRLPSTVRIDVVEREARAFVAVGDELYLCDREGEIFKRVAPDDPTNLPVVTGVTPGEVAADRAGAMLAVKRGLDVVEEVERTSLGKTYPVQEVHLGADGTVTLIVGRDGVSLHLGRGPYRDKVAQAAQVLGEVHRRKAKPATIFVDNEANPERVIVRMR